MEIFVDRETAFKYIDEVFATLQDKKRLLRTPIINFYGVGGIGKTFFLQRVRQRCQDEHLRCIWVDGSQNLSEIASEVIRQVQHYSVALNFEGNDSTSLYGAISAMRILLKRGAVVMLFDAIDTSNGGYEAWLEPLLRDLSDDKNLFIALTSKRALSFENDRSLARRLTLLPLLPFDRLACEAYMDALDTPIEPDVRASIFTWTHGYPLALSVTVQAVISGLDPRKNQKEIVTQLTNQVLYQNMLAKVDPAEHDRYLTILMLLSVPRYFNLILMQDLIETFTPQLKRENSLAYFGLPRELNQATEVLNWNPTGTGFSVDTPIRTIFLLKLQIEQPDLYYDVHSFLARTNRQWAADVTGADRVRYVCEYLYHGISSRGTVALEQFLTTTAQEIADAFPESFAQFVDEVTQDEDLKELLNGHLQTIKSLMPEG